MKSDESSFNRAGRLARTRPAGRRRFHAVPLARVLAPHVPAPHCRAKVRS